MTERNRLPDRRPCVTVGTQVAGRAVTVSVGFDPATGQAMEAFADIAKGNDAQHTLSDACVAVSIALQYGTPPAVLEAALGRVPGWVPDGDAMTQGDVPASPVGGVLAVIREVSEGVKQGGYFDAKGHGE